MEEKGGPQGRSSHATRARPTLRTDRTVPLSLATATVLVSGEPRQHDGGARDVPGINEEQHRGGRAGATPTARDGGHGGVIG